MVASGRQYDEMRTRVGEVRKQLAGLRDGTSGAGRLLQRDDLYTEWNRGLGRMIAVLDSLNVGEGAAGGVFVDAQPYEALNGAMRELRQTAEDFRKDPKKYLRLRVF